MCVYTTAMTYDPSSLLIYPLLNALSYYWNKLAEMKWTRASSCFPLNLVNSCLVMLE